MKFLIYQPSRSAMQSGKAKRKWILEPQDSNDQRHIESVMGWTSVKGTNSQLRFRFDEKQQAIDFAVKSNFNYRIIDPKKNIIRKKSYSDNFL